MTFHATFPTRFDTRPAPSLLLRARSLIETLFSFRDGAGLHPRITSMTRLLDRTDAEATVSPETHRRFQSAIVPHLDSAYNFARFLCRDADAAGDIVQDAFLRAYRSFEGYRGGDARAWTFAIVRNCYRAWQAEGRRRAHFEMPMTTGRNSETEEPAYQIASEAETPEAAAVQKSEAERVRKVIGGLSEPMREILVLRELEDLSYRQISDIIDVPIGTVMSRLARARAEFGEAWLALENAGAPR